jgi:tetratricopeptide (TPR) repeat protein
VERLAADFPTVVEYRLQLAAAHHDRGSLLERLDRPGEAEVAYRLAVDIRERLVTEFPGVPGYRQQLAQTHNNFGNLLKNWGKYDEADIALRRALEIREKLARDFPDVAEYALDLGASYCNVGHLVRDTGDPEAALDWFQQAIARLEPLVTREPGLMPATRFLRNSHWGRATTLDVLGQHAEATRDWERALELDDGSARDELRAAFAGSRLRGSQKEKDSAGCLAAAAENESLQRTDTVWLYDAACFRGVTAAVILEDANTEAADAARLAREQGDLAMDWLHKAVAAGFTDVDHLQQDSDLDALREREDFKKLLAELEAKQN